MGARYTLRQLEYFVAVGDAGSIAVAAGRLNISAPSISSAISQLEDALGVTLFVRQHAQGLALTPGGRRLYKAARELLEGAAALHGMAGEISDQISGPLSVGCLVTVAPYFLPELRKAFQDRFPEAAFRQEEAHQADLFRMIRAAEIDTAFTYDMEIPQDIAFEPLADLHPYALFAPDHPLAGHERVTLKDLTAHPLVLLDLPISRGYFLSLFQGVGLKPRIADRTSHLGMVRTMVANGFGYGLLNVPSATDRAPDGKPLVFRPIVDDIAPLKVGLLTMRTEKKPRILREFEALCRERVPPLALGPGR